jgi:hypothetical protein
MVDPQEFTPPYPTDISGANGANFQTNFGSQGDVNFNPNPQDFSQGFASNFNQFTAPSQAEFNNFQNPTAGFVPDFQTNLQPTPAPQQPAPTPIDVNQNIQNALSDAGLGNFTPAPQQIPQPNFNPAPEPVPNSVLNFNPAPEPANFNPNTNFQPAPEQISQPSQPNFEFNQPLPTPNQTEQPQTLVQPTGAGAYDQAPQGYTYTDNGFQEEGEIINQNQYPAQNQEFAYPADANYGDPNDPYSQDPNQYPPEDTFYDPNQQELLPPEPATNTFTQSTSGNRLFLFIGVGVVVLLFVVTAILFFINSSRQSSTNNSSSQISSVDTSQVISVPASGNQNQSDTGTSDGNQNNSSPDQTSSDFSSTDQTFSLPPLSQTGDPNTPASLSRLRSATRIPTDWLRDKFTSKDLDQFGNCAIPAICSNLSDPDQDGMTNIDEYNFDTDPLRPDIDSDGIADGDELFVYYTSPKAKDSDRDGFVDAVEISSCYDPISTETSKMKQSRIQTIVQNAQLKPVNPPTTNTLQTSGATLEELRQGLPISKCESFAIASSAPTLAPSPILGDQTSSLNINSSANNSSENLNTSSSASEEGSSETTPTLNP